MADIIFYILGLGAVINSLLVISSNNPIHSVFYLVIVFACAAMLLILLGIEFIPVLLMIVYVGAIAILFLFVVMMLNIRLVEYLENSSRYVPIGFIIGIIFIFVMYNQITELIVQEPSKNWIIETHNFLIIENNSNIAEVGQILYTEYFLYFIVSSMILLVAMIGAIILTLGHEAGVKRQDLFTQIHTSSKLPSIQNN